MMSNEGGPAARRPTAEPASEPFRDNSQTIPSGTPFPSSRRLFRFPFLRVPWRALAFGMTSRRNDAKRRAIENCELCDERGYFGRVVCGHDPDAPARAARGRRKVYQAMGWPLPDNAQPDGDTGGEPA